MKLAIVGSRSFSDYNLLVKEIDEYEFTLTQIVSGGAMGADTLAAKFALERKIELVVFLPDWSTGRGAGMVRNSKIVASCDRLIAFWDNKSRGTKDSIDKATRLGKLLKVVYY